jgi:hypothetical protein
MGDVDHTGYQEVGRVVGMLEGLISGRVESQQA